jgi:hypothetical protein
MNQQIAPQQLDAEASYMAPWSRSLSEFIVPDRFSTAVGQHLRANFAYRSARSKPALILAVQGAPGEGKTEMVNVCCAHLGCNVFHLSAAALSGKHEGDARQILLRNVATARRAELTNERPSVLVIDDMDRGVASLTDRTGHTINSSLLVGALQDLANDVHTISVAVPVSRVPIIMTANSFASLTGSLIRPGRMRFFTWDPTWREKAKMALPIFGRRTPVECMRLRRMVRWYHSKGEPLAFFVQLMHEYLGAAAPWPTNCSDILEAAKAFSGATEAALAVLDFRVLRLLARELHRAKARSFLRRDRCHV